MNTPDYFTRLIKTNAVHVEETTVLQPVIEPAWECQGCNETHESEREAEDCCPPIKVYMCPICSQQKDEIEAAIKCCEKNPPTKCPVCLRDAKTYSDAADCCLSLHPGLNHSLRGLVAIAAHSGTSWLDAIAQNTKH